MFYFLLKKGKVPIRNVCIFWLHDGPLGSLTHHHSPTTSLSLMLISLLAEYFADL